MDLECLLRLVAVATLTALPLSAAAAQNAEAPISPLTGTTWQLVKFVGGDDTTLTPADPSRYTVEFLDKGRVAVRFDCNRGNGTWKTNGSQLEFGPMALTRAMCPPGSLHDHLVKQWPNVRSYVRRDGKLFLSLMADGGIYEFEPHKDPKPTPPIG